eukprot:1832490-Lingulodinium_polyedra.AAC.1
MSMVPTAANGSAANVARHTCFSFRETSSISLALPGHSASGSEAFVNTRTQLRIARPVLPSSLC